MSQAPILRSSMLLKALAAAPGVRRTAPGSGFAATLAAAQDELPDTAPGANATRTAATRSAHPASRAPRTPAGQGVLQASSGLVPASISGTSLGTGVPFKELIQAAARRNGLDPALLAGLVKQESSFNPNARSGAGARGLTQLMPGTAQRLGVSDPSDPAQSLEGGARLLSGLLKQFGGDERLALAAYNAGPGAVQQYGGVPPYAETQRYVPRVLELAATFRRSGALA